MQHHHVVRALAAWTVLNGALLGAQSVHATRVVAHDSRGGAGGGTFLPANALGAPSGTSSAGSTHVHSLGVGGSLTLGFDVVITDGPGEDFLVAENPFYQAGLNWHSFAEVAYVEVSTDGVTFARFPAIYHGPAVSPGPFGSTRIGSYANLAGSTPVHQVAPADTTNVTRAGGDAFDLADLADHPAVLAGTVDLSAIHEVRFVDVRDGIDVDSRGVTIHDVSAGSADIDAVTVLHHVAALDPNGPRVGLTIPSDGRLRVVIEDPDTVFDLTALDVAAFGTPMSSAAFFGGLGLVQFTPTRVTFELMSPVPTGVLFQCAVSATDAGGARSGARAVRPGV